MRLLVLSDPHYAGPAERARAGWERRAVGNRLLRAIATLYRRWIWLADPTAHNQQLQRLIHAARDPHLVIANGDYSCDSGYIGVADPAARESAGECLAHLRRAFGERLHPILGDHELGKMSLFGGRGGPRLESWRRSVEELAIPAMWTLDLEDHALIGVASSLLALEVLEPELLDAERPGWHSLRRDYLQQLETELAAIPDSRRLVLFCHDPTALPYLQATTFYARLLQPRLEMTIIGHLHSELVLGTSRRLAGIPEVRGFGRTVHRYSAALRRAKDWEPFHPVLCPALSGIQCRRDGGYLELEFPGGRKPPKVRRCHLPW